MSLDQKVLVGHGHVAHDVGDPLSDRLGRADPGTARRLPRLEARRPFRPGVTRRRGDGRDRRERCHDDRGADQQPHLDARPPARRAALVDTPSDDGPPTVPGRRPLIGSTDGAAITCTKHLHASLSARCGRDGSRCGQAARPDVDGVRSRRQPTTGAASAEPVSGLKNAAFSPHMAQKSHRPSHGYTGARSSWRTLKHRKLVYQSTAGWSNRQLARFWPWNSRFESLPGSF